MAHGAVSAPASSVNLPFLLGAAILCGIGLTLMSAWMVTSTWLYFGAGVVTAVVGGLLLFARGTGADSA